VKAPPSFACSVILSLPPIPKSVLEPLY